MTSSKLSIRLITGVVVRGFVTLLFLPTVSPSQDLAELYRSILPPDVLNDPPACLQVSQLLSAKARIHPELMFLYLSFYGASEAGDFPAPDRAQLWNTIRSIEAGYMQRRSEWAEQVLAEISSLGENDEAQEQAAATVSALMRRQSPDSAVPEISGVDTNRMNSIIATFYSGVPYRTFDPATDYSNLRIEGENLHRKSLISKAQQAPTPAVIDEILNAWYLLDPEEGAYLEGKQLSIGELIVSILTSHGSTLKLPSVRLGIGVSVGRRVFSVAGTMPIKSGEDYEFAEPIASRDLTLSVAYRFFTREYFGMLSYVNIAVDVNITLSHAAPFQLTGFSRSENTAGILYSDNLTFGKGMATVNSLRSASFDIMTPILFFNEGTVLEFGAQGTISQLEFTIDYDYRYTRTRGYWAGSFWDPYWYTAIDVNTRDAGSLNAKATNFTISPAIGIAVQFRPSITGHFLASLNCTRVFLTYSL